MLVTFPRVLIISRTQIREDYSSGASRGSWFRLWPKEALGHAFSSKPESGEPYCGYNYHLTGKDRLFGSIFGRCKNLATESSDNYPAIKVLGRRNINSLKSFGTNCLINNGLWEVLFPPRMSPEFVSWVKNFRPDVLYAGVTDLSFMRYALMLQKHFKLPICMHIDDDWIATRYRGSPLGRSTHKLIERTFRRLIASSSACLSNGELMSQAFFTRYGKYFEPLMMCEDIKRFDYAQPIRKVGHDEVLVIYSGELELNRWQSLADLGQVVGELRKEGISIRVQVYTPLIPHEADDVLSRLFGIEYFPALRDAEVPGVLKGADILFLMEGFAETYRKYIRYSISAKSHLYMMSGRPILIYGPKNAGVVIYAKNAGWAYVVDQPILAQLRQALLRLINERSLSESLVKRAREVAKINHDALVVRERFRSVLSEILPKTGQGI